MYLLIDQVEEIDEKNKLRINNSLNYYDRLKNNDKLIFPQTNFNHENIFLEFPIICKEKKYKDYILQKSLNNYVDIKNYYYKNCESEKSYEIYKVSSSINSKYISISANTAVYDDKNKVINLSGAPSKIESSKENNVFYGLADKILFFNNERVHLIGNATMQYDGISITSNLIIFNPVTGNISTE